MSTDPVPPQLNTVNASPTKTFFIGVLIKDIQFIDAIVELVDNSVDAARVSGIALADVHIAIEFGPEHFSIGDNACGIGISVARNYAFRFGRPDGAPSTPGSVGEFGVGMKRALFKIGREFSITSKTSTDFFSMTVNVEKWQRQPELTSDWTFPMQESGQNTDPKDTGTRIVVTDLFDYAKDELTNTSFGSRLMTLLREAHSTALAEGLQISVGTTSLQAQVEKLLQSPQMTPLSSTQELEIDGKKVTVTIIAGIGERVLANAGWYIYCNGRQIERAEQTERTGWQSALVEGEKKSPKVHWQFARFRGYVLFESTHPSVLPWNTTKTGLDVEAPAYRRIRTDMATAMREVITFLNLLDAEGEGGTISATISHAAAVPLMNLEKSSTFVYKPPTVPVFQPRMTKISFDVDPDDYELVKKHMGAKNKTELGETLFSYYVESEGLDG